MNEQYFPVGQNGQSGHNAKLNMNIGKFLFSLDFERDRLSNTPSPGGRGQAHIGCFHNLLGYSGFKFPQQLGTKL